MVESPMLSGYRRLVVNSRAPRDMVRAPAVGYWQSALRVSA